MCTVHGKVMVSPSALVRLVGVEMMVAMGEVAGVDEAKVRRARGRPIGPMPIMPIMPIMPVKPIDDLGLQTIDQLMYSTYHLFLVCRMVIWPRCEQKCHKTLASSSLSFKTKYQYTIVPAIVSPSTDPVQWPGD